MKLDKFAAIAAFVFAGALSALALNSINPVPQSTKPDHWWQKRHAEKLQAVKNGGSDVVFIGDSITHFWESRGKAQWEKYFAGEPYKALNLGFSADRTEHVLWRLENGELDGYSPKAIVLMIGTNNTGHNSIEKERPADTVAGIKSIINLLRKKAPNATIILHPIFPRGWKPDDGNRARNEIVNGAIRTFVNGRDIVWCDFNDQLVEFDGTISKGMMGDALHPGAAGYEIWAKAVKPYIDRALAERKPRTVAPAYFPVHTERNASKRQQIVENKSGEFDLVFFGDSITHDWDRTGRGDRTALIQKYFSPCSILNLGNGGERVETCLWRAQNGLLDGYKAKVIMLMIGTNNGADSAEDVALGIRRLLDEIQLKQPQAKVLLLPIFPRNASPKDKHRVKNDKTNSIIKNYADNRRVYWLDFNKDFLQPDGTLTKDIMPDLLHPNLKGAEIWAKAVAPKLKELCGK